MNWNTEADRALCAHLNTYRPAPPPAFERAVRGGLRRHPRGAGWPRRRSGGARGSDPSAARCSRPAPAAAAVRRHRGLRARRARGGALVVRHRRRRRNTWPPARTRASPNARPGRDDRLAGPGPAPPSPSRIRARWRPSPSLLAARLVDDGVAFGETLYDGSTLYVALTLQNGFGIWLLEQYCGGNVTRGRDPAGAGWRAFSSRRCRRNTAAASRPITRWSRGGSTLTFPDGTTAGGRLRAPARLGRLSPLGQGAGPGRRQRRVPRNQRRGRLSGDADAL